MHLARVIPNPVGVRNLLRPKPVFAILL